MTSDSGEVLVNDDKQNADDFHETNSTEDHFLSLTASQTYNKEVNHPLVEEIESQENNNNINNINKVDNNLTRVHIQENELMSIKVEELRKYWQQQDLYIDSLELQLSQFNRDKCDLISLRESEEKLKQQQFEATRRENILVMRLTTKEQEMQEYMNQIQELKQSQVPTAAQLQSTLLDPAVNLTFERMRKEVDSARSKVEEMQNELSAWKFTPDSNTGKRLMAKCRLLYQENEELGKMISSGRVAKLEGDLALQKNFSEEMKKSQAELDEFLLELDEDVEGMQNTIYYLQQQLKEAKEKLSLLEKNPRIDNENNKTLISQKNTTNNNNNNMDSYRTENNSPQTLSINNNNNNITVRTFNSSYDNECDNNQILLANNGPIDLLNNETLDNSVDCINDGKLRTTINSERSIEEGENNNNSCTSSMDQESYSPTVIHINNDHNVNSTLNKRTSCLNADVENNETDDEDEKQPITKLAKLTQESAHHSINNNTSPSCNNSSDQVSSQQAVNACNKNNCSENGELNQLTVK